MHDETRKSVDFYFNALKCVLLQCIEMRSNLNLFFNSFNSVASFAEDWSSLNLQQSPLSENWPYDV